MKTATNIFLRYLISAIGLFLVAMGIALGVRSLFGIAPLSCPAFVMSQKWDALSFGEFNIAVNMVLLLIQIALFRKKFKVKYLWQIVTSFLLGYMIDFWGWVFQDVVPLTVWGKSGLVLAASFITAVGISMEVEMHAWMLSAEMTVYAITQVVPGSKFSTVKILMDVTFVLVSSAACLYFWGNPFGNCAGAEVKDILGANTQGVVIGLGTIALAILPGYLMRLTDKPVRRIFPFGAEYYLKEQEK